MTHDATFNDDLIDLAAQGIQACQDRRQMIAQIRPFDQSAGGAEKVIS
jgi:hypothetical protein